MTRSWHSTFIQGEERKIHGGSNILRLNVIATFSHLIYNCAKNILLSFKDSKLHMTSINHYYNPITEVEI